MMKKTHFLALLAGALLFSGCDRSDGEKIGEASTVFNLFGKNDRIEVESFSDPDVNGVSCYLSYAKKGGAKELVGLEVDTSDASISCVQTSPVVTFKEKDISKPSRIYRKNSSAVFKKLQVVRYYDEKRKVFSYLVYSDKVVEGSPKNAVAAISCQGMPPITAQTAGVPAQSQIIGGCAIQP